jgi:hypothetical protein
MEAEKSSESTAVPNGYEGHIERLSNEVNPINASATSSRVAKEKACKVWANSTRVGSDVGHRSVYSLDLPERMLHRIVKKFPQGGVLEYNDK